MEDGRSFACALNRVYDEIVQWKRNLFKVPSGKAGKAFVRELSGMFSAYAKGSALECVAMKAAMTIPALLLQKPSSRSKARDHSLQGGDFLLLAIMRFITSWWTCLVKSVTGLEPSRAYNL